MDCAGFGCEAGEPVVAAARTNIACARLAANKLTIDRARPGLESSCFTLRSLQWSCPGEARFDVRHVALVLLEA
jgi:hypothetical protein